MIDELLRADAITWGNKENIAHWIHERIHIRVHY